jgi:putative membrane protein
MSAGPVTQWIAAAALLAAMAYVTAVARLRWRGDRWPAGRDASFLAGTAAVIVAVTGPLPGGPFPAHMVAHVLLGMGAPLCLVLARPVTLTLRALRPGWTRRGLLRVLDSAPAAMLLFPPIAAVLDVGGLWLLYRTRLFTISQSRPWLDGLVHLHVLAAGLLFTAAICQLEPVRHRYGLTLRAATLVLVGAAHGVLAKTLWVTAPPGARAPVADVQRGAEIMYYGGDIVAIALTAVIALRWYTAAGRIRDRENRHANLHHHPAA